MRKFVLIFMLLISVGINAANPKDLKADLKQIRDAIVAYTNIKKAPIYYDKELEMFEVTLDCPAIWQGTVTYPSYNIDYVMSTFANIDYITVWHYDEEILYAEYRCNIDDDTYFCIMMDYYRCTNVLVITMYDPNI